MKKTLTTAKWAFALLTMTAAPLFTACDDDDVIVDEIPTNFGMNLSTLNIAWDETEGVVEMDANDSWKAHSQSGWITIDPTKGGAGSYRLYFLFDANPYRLPRTGQVEVVCNGVTETITVVQAGCSDNSKVAPCAGSLEIASFDYETGEIDLGTYAEAIMGNLGLTVDEFAQGIDEEGNLEFFMVGNDGEWIEGGTAGTRCGAWLDANLNVTGWDGAGYPAIATFLEFYNDEGTPLMVIGRAPGVPDNAEYELNFGFTLADDHSKFITFKVNVLFPEANLNGEVVGTIDLNLNMPPNDYGYYPVEFDANEVCAMLGAGSMAFMKVVAYDENGDFVPYTANNGYWYDTTGNIRGWGDGCGWFIEYHGDEAEPGDEDYNSWACGGFPGVLQAAGTSKLGFWYNGNVVMFNINITISE